jgi:hypothetical protein
MERLEEKMREYLLKGKAREERDKRIFKKRLEEKKFIWIHMAIFPRETRGEGDERIFATRKDWRRRY